MPVFNCPLPGGCHTYTFYRYNAATVFVKEYTMSESKTTEVIFRARGLTKVYRMGDVEVRALRGIDLALYQGEFVVMLGPSGSGKSTLLNILGGLDTPTAGEVWYHGEDLSHADDARLTRFRREHVGFVFQFYNLIPSLTARENVAIVTEIAPNPLPPAEALALVGLEGRLDHFPAQLSGGEQQRLSIARALLARPDVLFLDEATNQLDDETAAALMSLLRRELPDTLCIAVSHQTTVKALFTRRLPLDKAVPQED